MSDRSKTNFAELLGDLNAGVFAEQINHALTDIAANVVTHGKKGELTIKLSVKQIGESNQVTVTHSLKSVTPKPRGRIVEESESETTLHVAKGGALSLFPNTQTRMELGAGAATGSSTSHLGPIPRATN